MSNVGEESFRDAIATVEQSGKRVWLYPKKPRGTYYKWRKYVAYLLMGWLFVAPFIHVNGHQFLLFNFFERKFHIVGQPFWPQDFHLVVLLMIVGVVFVSVFTIAYGRIFCGWICPQTIFLEMLFRPIEYWIEGNRNAQMKLNKQPWTLSKIRKKVFKWGVYFLISLLISAVFMSYIIGSKVVIIRLSNPEAHVSTVIFWFIFSGVFYFVFAWFREQVCIIACPYGRLQSVLLDQSSVVVAYDNIRGEKETGRGKINKKENRERVGKGDCIDCNLCVDVCPTGIDIRNGTQLECVNCTACIDACNEVMKKVQFPSNLIRYTSLREINDRNSKRWTTRLKAYTTLLFSLIMVFIFLVVSRSDIETDFFRIPGQFYNIDNQEKTLRNVFTFKILNKTTAVIPELRFALMNVDNGTVYTVNKQFIRLDAEQILDGTIFVELPLSAWNGKPKKIKIGVYANNILLDKAPIRFVGPRNYRR